MCGIAGIVRYDRPGAESLPRVLEMLRRIRHRGPDGQGTYSGAWSALGNVRLALRDEAGGHQPMRSPDGRYWITYNGEVYNLPELREALAELWEFSSESDTEVVLAAWVVWGPEALPRLNGMFAFFVWDDWLGIGHGARDRLGIKPFVYAWDQAAFTFASEVKAILAIQPARPVAHLEAVLEYLVAPYYSGVEQPMVQGLAFLAPGHWLRISREGLHLESWWDYDLTGVLNDDFEGLAPALCCRLEAAVARAIPGDRPLGAFLSGGLDSTLISALARRHLSEPLSTYTIEFAGHADSGASLMVREDDAPYAAAAAKALGFAHQTVRVRQSNLPFDLAQLAAINDNLPAWEQELSQHHLARAASFSHKAIFVGDAADETHYGYPFLLDDCAAARPANVFSRFGLPPVNRALMEDAETYFDAKYQALARSAGHQWETPLGTLLASTYLVVKRWLPRLLHNGDIHTMAFSLEARVPFADSELLDLAQTVHPGIAFGDGQEKRLLREAVRGLLPEVNRVRPKSALPKDQGTGRIYQEQARQALKDSGDFLATWLDIKPLTTLANSSRPPSENERSLLFRVIALHQWRITYGVRSP